MNPESQVTNLELSKRLRELNVKQESLFYWHYINDNCYSVRYITARTNCAGEYLYSAFTVAELINMLREYWSHDIMIPSNVNIANFLGEKLIGLYEARSKKD